MWCYFMLSKFKDLIKNLLNKLGAFFSKLYISSKFLLIIGSLCFLIISGSVFVPELDASGNIVTIRTLFSAIVGFILENTSKKVLCTDHFLILKNYCVGSLAVATTIILAGSIFFSVDVNNPSLILLKNLMFSTVGFLISSSKECQD